MNNIEQKGYLGKPSKQMLQEWMDSISYALVHIPAGHQVDLAREIINTHYPHMPDLSFMGDRGDIMMWASTQEARALSDTLEVVIAELGSRRVPEAESKRMLKIAWDNLPSGSKKSFLEWAAKGLDDE